MAKSTTASVWRHRLDALVAEAVDLIEEHADPEVRFSIARAASEDLRDTIADNLRAAYGCVFDPLWDGPPQPQAARQPA